MKIKEIIIDMLDWKMVCIILNKKDKNITDILTSYNLFQEDIDYVNEHIDNHTINAGVCLSYIDRRFSIMVIYPSIDKSEFISSITHEIRHCVDRICEYNDINDYETSAYMTGYISKNFII